MNKIISSSGRKNAVVTCHIPLCDKWCSHIKFAPSASIQRQGLDREPVLVLSSTIVPSSYSPSHIFFDQIAFFESKCRLQSGVCSNLCDYNMTTPPYLLCGGYGLSLRICMPQSIGPCLNRKTIANLSFDIDEEEEDSVSPPPVAARRRFDDEEDEDVRLLAPTLTQPCRLSNNLLSHFIGP